MNEPRKLSDKPLNEIHVGDKVRSLNTGTLGIVTYVSKEIVKEDYVLNFKWDDGNVSESVWHFWLTEIVEAD